MVAVEEDKVVTVEEGKALTTPDEKNVPASADCQPSNNVTNSENPSDGNKENSEVQPNKDLSNNKTEPEQGLPTLVTVEEDKALTTPDEKNVPASADCQPSNNVTNSENPSDGNKENSEVQPNKDLSNIKTEPEQGLPTSELQASGGDANGGTSTHQLDNTEEPPNHKPDNAESPSNDQPSNAEAHEKNQPVDSEAPLNNPQVHSETSPDNQTATSGATLDKKSASEAPPSNLPVTCEALPNSGDLQTRNEVVVSETQHSNEVALPETQQSNDVIIPETQPSHDVEMSDSQPVNHEEISDEEISHDVIMTEGMAENELPVSTTDPNNHQFTDFHMIPEDHNQLPDCDPLPSSEPLADIKSIPHDHLTQYDSVANNHLDHSEAMSNQILPHYELGNNEALHEHQLVSSQGHYEIVNANPSYEIVNAETPLNCEQPTPETQPNKRRKKKSIVWEHFTIENVSAGCRRACCKQCKQSFAYSTGSKVAGTSHLKRHIAKGACSALLRSQDPNHLNTYTPRSRGNGVGNASTTPKRRYRSPGTPYIIFDQDRCRHEIARMVIMHDYPLHMVEHPGFVAFVQNLQPQFNMVTFNTVQGDCVATYLVEKQNIMKYFDGLPGRFCLTLDTWTSSQSVGYVFITGHFVDSDWKLQSRVLNLVMEPNPESDSAVSHALSACLSDWALESRLFSITCNQELGEGALANIRSLLSVKNPHILNGQLVVGNCIARTLSSVANGLLSSVQGTVKKIRDSVKYVKTSESHEEKFLDIKQHLQVPSERSLFIDDQTKWNTTYQMLVAASELKEVFSCLDTSDPDYKGAPSMQDWKVVETLCTYLKPLYDAANILTTTTHPTAVTFFHEVWKLHLDMARAVMNEDPFISNLTKPMQEKIDKYWRHCNLILATAVVMDPRFKMKLVEFSFTKIYGDDAHVYVKIVDDGVHELFHEYETLPLPLTPAYAEEGNGKTEGSPSGTLLSDHGLTDFDVYIMETSNQRMKSELDQYLEESLLPRVPDFDVLGWWKLNKLKYPTLSKMARDILCVPVSSVPSDSVFNSKSKEVDPYKCSLRPETLEAIVCAKDWMQYGAGKYGRAGESSNALVKVEF